MDEVIKRLSKFNDKEINKSLDRLFALGNIPKGKYVTTNDGIMFYLAKKEKEDGETKCHGEGTGENNVCSKGREKRTVKKKSNKKNKRRT